MEPINSIIHKTCKVFKDVYIRDSIVQGGATLSDRSVIISSNIAEKVEIGRDCSVIHTTIGYGSFLGKGSVCKSSLIGKYCNLSWHLSIGGSNHNYKSACMYTESWWKRTFNIGDGFVPISEKEKTVIGNDVWVGAQANIIRGAKIGDGAVIGANALVLSDVPPYSIVVGCPAKVIKYRFENSIITRLLAVKWWDWDITSIKEAAEFLRGDLDEYKLQCIEDIAKRKNVLE